ncbi:MAG: DNA methyltransferase [Acetobacteraceae bacterium]
MRAISERSPRQWSMAGSVQGGRRPVMPAAPKPAVQRMALGEWEWQGRVVSKLSAFRHSRGEADIQSLLRSDHTTRHAARVLTEVAVAASRCNRFSTTAESPGQAITTSRSFRGSCRATGAPMVDAGGHSGQDSMDDRVRRIGGSVRGAGRKGGERPAAINETRLALFPPPCRARTSTAPRGGDVLSRGHELNAICPYFTMFPLEFPLRILRRHSKQCERVLDPFCGRGTTNFAARLTNLYSVGIDASPVAQAITAAKLVSPTAETIERELAAILTEAPTEAPPDSEFWRLVFHPSVLADLCRLRSALGADCHSPERVALRALTLGALHGPSQRTPGYLSNQSPRTYAPKPAYAVRFWSERGLMPQRVDLPSVICQRARRFYSYGRATYGHAELADSRNASAFRGAEFAKPFSWVITSPPYYGMKTYIADQWLRNWFLGGPDRVDYDTKGQVTHRSPDQFATDLRSVWRNARLVCHDGAKMVVRFGGICDRRIEPTELVTASLQGTGWRISTARPAGDAKAGKRQADSFLSSRSKPLVEYDIWARAV